MSEESQTLMYELRDAMSKMPDDPEGLAGWLLSNYDLYKKGSGEPTEFHRKKIGGGVGQNGKLKIADSAAIRFMKLAGADKVVQNPRAAAIVAAINSAQDPQEIEYPEEEMTVEDESEDEQMEALHAAALAAKQGKRKITAKDLLANNVPISLDGEGRPLSAQETAIVQNMWGGGDVNSSSPYDPPNIQIDRMKRLMAQRELNEGGSIGKITRR